MNRIGPENPIGLLNPITDADAAASVSRETLEELAAAVMAVPAPASRRSPRVTIRSRTQRRGRGLALAAGAAAAAVLGMSGMLSGHGPTIAQPADAQILRGAAAALHPSGSIVIESLRTASTWPRMCGRGKSHAACRLIRKGDGQWSVIRETSSGYLGNELELKEPGFRPGMEMADIRGGHELFDPARNTVYVFSDYGHDITPGHKPGTYRYSLPSRRPLFWSQPVVPDSNPPIPDLTITARQAQDLRDGVARIDVFKTPAGQYRMRVAPAFRTPDGSPAAQARVWLGPLKVAGPTVVDGRKAIKLVPIHGRGEYDVEPRSYYPIRQIQVDPSGVIYTITWSEYRVLPATAHNRSLLSLTARHQSARVDLSNANYLAAWDRLTFGED